MDEKRYSKFDVQRCGNNVVLAFAAVVTTMLVVENGLQGDWETMTAWIVCLLWIGNMLQTWNLTMPNERRRAGRGE